MAAVSLAMPMKLWDSAGWECGRTFLYLLPPLGAYKSQLGGTYILLRCCFMLSLTPVIILYTYIYYTYIHTYVHTYIHTYIHYIHYTTLHYITIQNKTIQYINTLNTLNTLHTLHTLHYTTLHYITLHYITLHYIHYKHYKHYKHT